MPYFLILLLFLLTSCSQSNTDALEPHQIVTAPRFQWIHWDQDPAIDVTEAQIKTRQTCPKRVID